MNSDTKETFDSMRFGISELQLAAIRGEIWKVMCLRLYQEHKVEIGSLIDGFEESFQANAESYKLAGVGGQTQDAWVQIKSELRALT